MAKLGFRTINEMVGRVDRLDGAKVIDNWKAKNIDFSMIAKACGYNIIFSGNKIDLIDKLFSVNENEGPIFGHLKICSGTIKNLPRPSIKPDQVLRRMMQHINTNF